MVEIRTITDDEVPAFTAAVATGFHGHAHPGTAEFQRRFLELDRTYAAFDDGAVVGTARSFGAELTVPGGRRLPVAAVTAVTVTATHRRRGVLTQLMGRQLRELVGRGEPAAILIASEAPIYGRFGYGPATEHVLVEVDAVAAQFRGPAPPGSVRLCTAAEMRAEAPAVYERLRRAQPGAIDRPDRWWDVQLGLIPRPGQEPELSPAFLALYRDADGRVDGYARYRIKGEWDYRVPRSLLEVDDLGAATDDAYAALWRHCLGVDWVTRVQAENRPPLEPLPWLLTNSRAARQRQRADLLWVRLLDVPAALAARRYRVAERLTLEVLDSAGDIEPSRFLLEAGEEGATCRSTTDDPDLTLGLDDLGAAYLGGTALWPAAAAGRVRQHRAGAVAAFDRLFLTDRAPWCNTWF